MISAAAPEIGSCPGCGEQSARRHSRYFRHLQDLPVQGPVVIVKMGVSRCRCLNGECERRTFTDQLPEIVVPTPAGPSESLKLFIFSAMALAVGRQKG